MITNWLRRLSLFATLLVVSSSLAYGAVTLYHYYWTSNGMRFSCVPTLNKIVFQCVSPLGHVVFVNAEQVKVTGDTAQGCRPNPYHLTVVRNPEDLCFQDLNADPDEAIAMIADTMTTEQFNAWQDQELPGEYALYEPEPQKGMKLVKVPCNDGAQEGSVDWSELIYAMTPESTFEQEVLGEEAVEGLIE